MARTIVKAVLALFALGCVVVRGDASALAVSGIAGVTFLAQDLASLERFYGHGAGFAEAVHGPDELRFVVGSEQWLEFRQVRDPQETRRMQSVTLRAADLGKVESQLRERGLAATWVQADAQTKVLEIRDPAGDRLQISGPLVPHALASPGDRPFSSHLQHVGFAVPRASTEATIAFYRDTLGLSETFRMPGSDGRLGLVKFLLPGPGRDLIELIFFDPPLNKWAAGAFDHVNFEVPEIGAAYRRLKEGGIAMKSSHRPTVNAERLWAINIIDPELTRMEIQVLAPAAEAIGTIYSSTGTLQDELPPPTSSQ